MTQQQITNKVAIVGSRTFAYPEKVREYVRSLPPGTIVVSGGAKGVDTIAEKEAIRCGLEIEIYYAKWNKHGKMAGYIRNTDIVEAADHIVAFWDGESTGTRDTISKTLRAKKRLTMIPENWCNG
jgi:hypothetical protein